jgi:hypothetical protein
LAKGVWNFRKNYLESFKPVASIIAYIAKNHDAAVELLAAIWEVWLEKVQFRTDIPGNRIEHLAYSFVHAADVAQADNFAVKRLWDAYMLLIARMHGSRMDTQREREARRFVGRLAAQLASRTEGGNLGEKLSGVLSSGLIRGYK